MSIERLTVSLGERSYPIHIGAGLLGNAELYAPHAAGRIAAIVSNETVAPLYAARVEAALASAGARPMLVTLPDGEAYKDWKTLDRIFAALLQARADRRTVLVALGGGVVGDMAGFAAATYQRGITHVQVPTTLLAQVDSSVGGKTGINSSHGKNLIGAFHQPIHVLADTALLDTLPEREFRAGYAELAKVGLVADEPFFAWLEAHWPEIFAGGPAREQAIAEACRFKAAVVARDEREAGERALLNLGHTFGHAVEAATGYGAWLHGEAVGLGMLMAADLSRRLGRLPAEAVARVAALLERASLPTRLPADIATDTLLGYMAGDKKVQDGQLRLVVLDAIGQGAIVEGVAPELLAAVIDAARAPAVA